MKKIITASLLLTSILICAQTTAGKHSIYKQDVNTKMADFGVAYLNNKEIVFASPTEKVTIVKRVWHENDQPFLDLFIGDIDSTGQIVNKRILPGTVNRKEHEAIVAFTKDRKTVYFSANNYSSKDKSIKGKSGFDNIQLYRASIQENGEWTNIKKLPFNSDNFQSGLPSLNKDDTKLYFVSDRPESIGKTDIYVVDIHKDGTFGKPKNLGPRINTEEREMFPFISNDNILYYSSNGFEGFGRLDVYASKIFDNTVSVPLNLEEPINSARDDFAYILDDTSRKGFFSTNRPGGKGDDDIYAFKQDVPVFIECLQTIKGVVRDKDTQELLPGAIVSILDSQGNQLQITAANEDDASYSFDVPCNSAYTIVGTNAKYLKEKIQVKTVNDIEQPPVVQNVDLATEFILVGDEVLINIDKIYFDFNKWNIRTDAAQQLDKVVDVMKTYPEMKIFAASYTDSRGPSSYNMWLSKKRAKSSAAYIISKGIDAERIRSEGFGETELVNDCGNGKRCSEAEHQLNRRTHFKVEESFKIKRK